MSRPSRPVSALFAGAALLLALATLPACSPPPATSFASTAGLPQVSPLPAELVAALDSFRAEGPRGWAFTQTTKGRERNTVERFDPLQRGSARWTLLSENDKPPTEEEQQRYRDTRPNFDSASNLAQQLDRTAAWLVSEDEQSSVYEFRLKPQNEKDKAAAHMHARFTLDRASGSILRVELFSFESFKPAASLTIQEARTTLVYSAPKDGLPALPQEVKMHIRGERFWLADFEQTITSTYSDFENRALAASKD